MTRHGIRGCLLTLAVLAAAGGAPARAQWEEKAPTPRGGRAVGFLLRMSFEGGGDKLASVEWEDGDETDIKAGGLATFAGGLLYHPAAPYAVEATFGYKFDKANAENGKIQFTRWPVDLIVSWVPYRGNRLGIGGTVHLSPKFTCEVDGICDGSVTFDNAFGTIVQYAYGWGRDQGFELGARATFIHYKHEGLEAIDGTCFGVIVGGWL